MPSCKISWWKHVSQKGEKLFALNLQHFQFGQNGWKTLSMKTS